MIVRFRELSCKEVINICDGKRLGYVTDLELEAESGRVISICVPCPGRFFGLFGDRGRYVIPWPCIRRVGDDLILVDVCLQDVRHEREKRNIFS